jgi:hypothetical protein
MLTDILTYFALLEFEFLTEKSKPGKSSTFWKEKQKRPAKVAEGDLTW